MTQAVAPSSTIVGVEAIPVEVQVDVSNGLPAFTIVGLGDAAVLEARERVRSALRASGFDFPNSRVTVNLAPAPVRKHGTGFDLPIAIGILAATGQVPPEILTAVAVGELGLDGTVRPVPGLLAHAVAARRSQRSLIVAAEAEPEMGRWRRRASCPHRRSAPYAEACRHRSVAPKCARSHTATSRISRR